MISPQTNNILQKYLLIIYDKIVHESLSKTRQQQ